MKKNRKSTRKAKLPYKLGSLAHLQTNPSDYAIHHGLHIERLLEKPDGHEAIVDALHSALVELSNDTGVYHDHPNLVFAFFREAIREATRNNEIKESTLRVLYEIHALLSGPTPSMVSEIAARYDGESLANPSAEYPAACEPRFGEYADTNPSEEHKKFLDTLLAAGDPRPVRKRKAKKTRKVQGNGVDANPEVESLRQRLQRLERLPENEAVAFQLETEIYRLERETQNGDNWPDIVGESLTEDNALWEALENDDDEALLEILYPETNQTEGSAE